MTCILQMVNGDVLHSYKHIGHKRTLQSTVVQSASVKCLNMSWLDTVEEILDLVISYFSSPNINALVFLFLFLITLHMRNKILFLLKRTPEQQGCPYIASIHYYTCICPYIASIHYYTCILFSRWLPRIWEIKFYTRNNTNSNSKNIQI